MDKYELSIKEDKIKKHADKKDFVSAAKIADTIDWSKVKNIKMLTLVSQVYEKMKNYTEAKNVLLLAYERVPVGRRMLYKLTELCIKAGNLDEAEEFFEEFQEIAPNDISKLILAYQIEAARGEPLDKLITILELYRKNEFEEKWAYELAYLYHKAGRVKDCVQLCNEIILWFSVGPYVDKALNLKMQYEPLTPSQQEKLVNKKKFEERVRAVEREFEEKYSQETLDARGSAEEPDNSREELRETAMTEEFAEDGFAQDEFAQDEFAQDEFAQEQFAEPELTEEASVDEASGMLFADAFQDMQADLAQAVRAAADDLPVEEETAAQDTRELMGQTRELVKPEPEAVPEKDLGQTAEFLNDVSAALAASVFAEEPEEEPEEEPVESEEEEPEYEAASEEKPVLPDDEEPEEEEPELPAYEAEEPAAPEETAPSEEEADDDAAADELVNEVSAAMAAMVPEMEEDFETVSEVSEEFRITCVVVDAEPGPGRVPLAVEKLKKTHEILETPATQVAKISGEKLNARGIHGTFAKLAGRDLIVDGAADMSDETASELAAELEHPFVSMVVILVDSTDRIDELLAANPALDRLCVYLDDESEMSIDDFVACANEYAQEEECVIDEMAGLAIYAAAERMRNEGIELSEEAARNLVDDAIDKAEHRGIKGLFASKYDKEGYLILKEQFFKNM